MPDNTRNKICDLYCGTHGTQFGNQPCPQYDLLSQECAFLRAQQAEKLWERADDETPLCRCAFELFYDVVKDCDKAMHTQYARLPVMEAEDIPFQDMIQRLKRQKFTNATLAAWYKYVKKMAFREIRKILVKRGLLPAQKQCGTCMHWPPSEPRLCAKTDQIRRMTDNARDCVHYQPTSIGRFQSFEANMRRFQRHDADIDLGEAAEPHEKSAELPDVLRYEMTTFDMLKATNEAAQTMEEPGELRMEIEQWLRRRAEQEQPGSARRKKFRRQHEVFINIAALLTEGVPKEQAEKTLAKRYGLKDARTIRRDLEDIRAFLRENVRTIGKNASHP